MTYCVERTNLLREAGRDLATKLLPDAFGLWHSDHDTGAQMTIITRANPHLPVWRGSIWHSSIYEIHDRGHDHGLQPDFQFAADAIDQYFSDVAKAVADRNAQRALAAEQCACAAQDERTTVINQTRAAISQAQP